MSTQELISRPAFLGTTSTFFALAIILASLRTIIRIYKWRRIFVDDYFFFLAVICHIISTGLVFEEVPNLYMFATLLSSNKALPKGFVKLALSQGAARILNTIWASEALIWGTIFCVKFSFLFYFRGLVWQIKNLRLLWWVTFVFLVPAASVSISSAWIVCPYTGDDILLRCVITPDFLKREKLILACTVTFDILTDVMLICIPIRLLQQAKFKIREKVNVGIVLCLSIVIIAISMVRAISFAVHGTIDQVWDEFWIQLEASISIIVVCMTAFRTLFVTSISSTRNNNSPRTGRNGKQYRTPWSQRSSNSLPDIETGAILMGMRTAIRDNGKTTSEDFLEPNSPPKSPWHNEAIVLERPERIFPVGGLNQPGVDASPWARG